MEGGLGLGRNVQQIAEVPGLEPWTGDYRN